MSATIIAAERSVFRRMLESVEDPARLVYWTRHRERLDGLLRAEARREFGPSLGEASVEHFRRSGYEDWPLRSAVPSIGGAPEDLPVLVEVAETRRPSCLPPFWLPIFRPRRTARRAPI